MEELDRQNDWKRVDHFNHFRMITPPHCGEGISMNYFPQKVHPISALLLSVEQRYVKCVDALQRCSQLLHGEQRGPSGKAG